MTKSNKIEKFIFCVISSIGGENRRIQKKSPTCRKSLTTFITYSNITSFFRFVNKRAIYRLGIFSLAHAPVHVTDFPVVNVHADELSSARIWQHTFCATLSANVNINYVFQSKYTTVFVLLDISESKRFVEARMCFKF